MRRNAGQIAMPISAGKAKANHPVHSLHEDCFQSPLSPKNDNSSSDHNRLALNNFRNISTRCGERWRKRGEWVGCRWQNLPTEWTPITDWAGTPSLLPGRMQPACWRRFVCQLTVLYWHVYYTCDKSHRAWLGVPFRYPFQVWPLSL